MIQEIIKLKEQGFKSSEISVKLNIHPSSLFRLCKKHNVKFSLSESRIEMDRKIKIKELYEKGHSCRDISKILGIKKLKTISHYLKQIGIFKEKKKNKAVEIELNQIQKEVFYGCLLGDSSMELNSNKTKARFKLSHCLKQKEYLLHKKEIFGELLSDDFERFNGFSIQNEVLTRVDCNSFFTKSLKQIYDLFYINGRKSITEENVKLLTIQSFAYLFMDDGTKDYSCIFTMSFTEKENELLVQQFNTLFNVNFVLNKVYKTFTDVNNIEHYKKEYTVIRAKTILDSMIFKTKIRNYVPESMKYKLNK